MKAIETAIARDASSGSPEYVDNVVVLDDVTAALCKSEFGISGLQHQSRRRSPISASR